MPFVYLDDQFPDHPKVIRAGADAAWLFVCGLAYSRRYGTGGAIPTAQVSKLTTLRNPLKLAGRLCAERLWEVIRDGFQIHDYVDRPLRRSISGMILRRLVIERDGYVCRLCGGPVEPSDVHLDHILPVVRGGRDCESNLQVTHSRCNLRKGASA